MANESKNMEEKLLELGNRLSSSPLPAAGELYALLEHIDRALSIVEQSPSEAMLKALKPLMEALAVKELLRHSDKDVKVAVASCISEITRITAPEAPYEDEIMKEIFQMIVDAFEGLDDLSSSSFQKRVSILETVAKVRSCVVMLDLECDVLILQMFHHFLKTIRENHSSAIYKSMETVMSLVIEESEDISPELLSALLDTLKMENKGALPVAKQLAEEVMKNCAIKLKPCMMELIKSKGASLSEYSEVVTSICQGSTSSDYIEEQISHEPLADESKLSERTVSDELPQVSAKTEQEVGCPEKVEGAAVTSLVAATSNGDVAMGNSDTVEQPSSPKQKCELSRHSGQSRSLGLKGSNIGNAESISTKPDEIADRVKEKGGETDSVAQLTESIDQMDSDKEATVVPNTTDPGKERESTSAQKGAQGDETTLSPEHESKNEPQHIPGTDGPTSDCLPSPVSSPPNSSRKRGRPPGPKSAKHNNVNAAAAKPTSVSVQDNPSKNPGADEGLTSKDDDSKKSEKAHDAEAPTSLTEDSEAKPSNASGKKGRPKRKTVEKESSGQKQTSNSKQLKEEKTHGKDEPKMKEVAPSPSSASKVRNIDETCYDDSSKPKRRKQSSETGKMHETPDRKKQMDEHLVGSRIRVWWPDDEAYYEGTVESYDHSENRHKVVYNDGDVEYLILEEEQWQFVESDTENTGGKQKAEGSAMQRTRGRKKKGSSSAPSKQTKSQGPKSGTETASRTVPKPRGRPRSAMSDGKKLSYDDAAGTSEKTKGKSYDAAVEKTKGKSIDEAAPILEKSKGKSTNSDKKKTPRSGGRTPKDEPQDELEERTPIASNKREESGGKPKNLASKPGSAPKGDSSKNSGKLKDERSKSGRKSRTETPKTSTRPKDETPKVASKSDDETTPEADIKDKTNEKKQRRKRKIVDSTPETVVDANANGVSSKGKSKVGESAGSAQASDGEVKTGNVKGKKKSRK